MLGLIVYGLPYIALVAVLVAVILVVHAGKEMLYRGYAANMRHTDAFGDDGLMPRHSPQGASNNPGDQLTEAVLGWDSRSEFHDMRIQPDTGAVDAIGGVCDVGLFGVIGGIGGTGGMAGASPIGGMSGIGTIDSPGGKAGL